MKLNKRETSDTGHHIVADGWAGTSQPHSHPPPPHTHSHTHTITTALCQMLFLTQSSRTDRQTNGLTDGWTKPQQNTIFEENVKLIKTALSAFMQS